MHKAVININEIPVYSTYQLPIVRTSRKCLPNAKAPDRAEIADNGAPLNKTGKAYKATVICDIRSLTRKKPNGANRALDSLHVEYLKGIFIARL